MTDNGIEIRLKALQEDINHEASMRRKLEARITALEARITVDETQFNKLVDVILTLIRHVMRR